MRRLIFALTIAFCLSMISGCGYLTNEPASESEPSNGMKQETEYNGLGLEIVESNYSDDITSWVEHDTFDWYNYAIAIKNNSNKVATDIRIMVHVLYEDGTTWDHEDKVGAPFIFPGETIYWGREDTHPTDRAKMKSMLFSAEAKNYISKKEALKLNGNPADLYIENYSLSPSPEGIDMKGTCVNKTDSYYRLAFVVTILRQNGRIVGCVSPFSIDRSTSSPPNSSIPFNAGQIFGLNSVFDETDIYVYGWTKDTMDYLGVERMYDILY